MSSTEVDGGEVSGVVDVGVTRDGIGDWVGVGIGAGVTHMSESSSGL